MLTMEQAGAYFKDRDSLIIFMKRKGYLLPSKSDTAFCSTKFMLGVLRSEYWLPLCEHSEYRQCADPPKKEVVRDALVEELDKVCPTDADRTDEPKFHNTAQLLKKKMPRREFMLNLLASLNPVHPFFEPSYRRPREEKVQAVAISTMEFPAEVFEGMPMYSGPISKIKIRHGITKRQRHDIKTQNLEARLSKLKAQLKDHKQVLEENSLSGDSDYDDEEESKGPGGQQPPDQPHHGASDRQTKIGGPEQNPIQGASLPQYGLQAQDQFLPSQAAAQIKQGQPFQSQVLQSFGQDQKQLAEKVDGDQDSQENNYHDAHGPQPSSTPSKMLTRAQRRAAASSIRTKMDSMQVSHPAPSDFDQQIAAGQMGDTEMQ